MSKILIVVGHPLPNTFCEALGKAYKDGAESAGHQATLVLLSQIAFDPILREGFHRVQPLEPDLQAAYRAFKDCDHWVLIFPLWYGDMPALMKGFIERILQPDLIAHPAGDNAMNWSLFKNKTARIVMTMGMPVSIYRYWYGGHALKLLARNILNFIGIKPVRQTLFGMLGTSKPETRTRWLREVHDLGKNGA
jgi:NAD(P)H dehydrogenase (quinone)